MERTLTVKGMSCGGCEAHVVEALEAVPGITKARADRGRAQAVVEGDAPTDALLQAVADAGYEAEA